MLTREVEVRNCLLKKRTARFGSPPGQYLVPHAGTVIPMIQEAAITLCLRNLKAGENVDRSAGVLWAYFKTSLCSLADTYTRGHAFCFDEDDLASLTFAHFCQSLISGQLENVKTGECALRVLAFILSQKAATLIESEHRHKRGRGSVVRESVLASKSLYGFNFDHFEGKAQSGNSDKLPPWLLEWLESLSSPLRTTVLMRLEGFANEEIAQELGCGLRTVERHLQELRVLLARVVRND